MRIRSALSPAALSPAALSPAALSPAALSVASSSVAALSIAGLSVAALMGCASAGWAADLPSRVAPPVAVPPALLFNWTGFYVGALAGAQEQRSDVATAIRPGTHLLAPANLSAVSAAGTSSGRQTGFLAGGEVGYNYQINAIVLGLEGDAQYVDADRSVLGAGLLTTGDTFGITTRTRESLLATARGRVGYAFDRLLIFASGGAAFTDRRIEQAYTDTLAGPTTGRLSKQGPTVGFAVGGGLEYAVTNNLSIKAEYLLTRFDGIEGAYTIRSQTGSTNQLRVSTPSDTLQVARIGLNYRFDLSGLVAGH